MEVRNILYMPAIKLANGRTFNDSFDLNRMIPDESKKTLLFASHKKGECEVKFNWLEFEGIEVNIRELFILNIN